MPEVTFTVKTKNQSINKNSFEEAYNLLNALRKLNLKPQLIANSVSIDGVYYGSVCIF